ncbi:XdhC family protein [Shewanella sp. A32]|uniref:XdhC family protein n=1 Tax=Shewanella sp. A32 TaxID=3031327 RepID=UPI0023B8E170|nr:XdhC family protein [Shewanella sp. A32]MDF0534950.1 XdhC family protein [Shewanella sp. A32]
MSQSSQPLDAKVLQQASAWATHDAIWLCTVLHTWGSSPRSPGSLLVARHDGQYCGSLSGGCVEDHFLTQIAAGRWTEPSQVVRYGDGELAPEVRLPCGGILDVLVEYLPAGTQTVDYLHQQLQAVQGYQALVKKLTLPNACHSIVPSDYSGNTVISCQYPDIDIHMAAAPCLLLAGYSPVAHYCAEFGYALGFEVLLCEPRAEQLQKLETELPQGARLLPTFPAKYLEENGCHANTAIVALTHDPRLDDLTMMEAVNTPAFYIGAMGSARNSGKRRERLIRIGELSDAELARIHAPIGLALGSKTPAEIALAIMADIVRVKNLGHLTPAPVVQGTLDTLESISEDAASCAI